MERDVIIILQNMDYGLVTLNGKYLYEIEGGHEVGEMLLKLFSKLGQYAKAPLVYAFWTDDYLDDEKQEKLFDATTNRGKCIFTPEEINVLRTTNFSTFIKTVKSNLK